MANCSTFVSFLFFSPPSWLILHPNLLSNSLHVKEVATWPPGAQRSSPSWSTGWLRPCPPPPSCPSSTRASWAPVEIWKRDWVNVAHCSHPPNSIVIQPVWVVTKYSTGSESRSDESHSGRDSPTSGHKTCYNWWIFVFFAGPEFEEGAKISQWRQTVDQDAGCIRRWGRWGWVDVSGWGPYWEVAERRSDNPAFLLAHLQPITDQSLARQDWENSDAIYQDW